MSNSRTLIVSTTATLMVDTNSNRVIVTNIPPGAPGSSSLVASNGQILLDGGYLSLEIRQDRMRLVLASGDDTTYLFSGARLALIPLKDPTAGRISYAFI